MYNIHLGLTGKHVVDFLLELSELFSLGVTVEALRAKIDRKFDPKYQVEGVANNFCTDS